MASVSKADLVYSLGADHVIDYRTKYLDENKGKYDLIVDIGGRNSVSSLRRVLKQEGTLVFVGGEGGNRVTGGIGRQLRAVLMSPFLKQNLRMFVSGEKHSMMVRLSEFIRSGAVKPTVGRRFTLDEVPVAMRWLGGRQRRGKNSDQGRTVIGGINLAGRPIEISRSNSISVLDQIGRSTPKTVNDWVRNFFRRPGRRRNKVTTFEVRFVVQGK